VKKQTRQGFQRAALVLAAAAPSALAQSALLAAPVQVGISAGAVLPEDLRGVSPAPTGRLTLGLPLRPGAYVDASVFGFRAKGEAGRDSERSLGGGLDLRLERLDERFNYLFLVGGGYVATQRGNAKINAPYANIGWGLGYELSPALTLRGELRGLARFDPAFVPGRSVSYDATSSVGLFYSFGQKPPTPFHSDAVVAAAAPVPSLPPEVALEPQPLAPLVATPARVVPPVLSPEDACPPPPAKAQVDANGCLMPQSLNLPRAEFFAGLESTEVLPSADASLRAVAAALIKNPQLFAQIRVHTDSVGYEDKNLADTQALAKLLNERLFQLGVAVDRFSTEGIGEERPRASEDTAAGVEQNRRVEIRLIER